MHNKSKDDSLQVEAFFPKIDDRATVSDWLSDIETALDDSDQDMRRKYLNIGGQNGLELFV